MSVKFLSDTVKELENALFVSESNALISLPTHMIRNSEVDEEGNIWFIIPKPTQVIESFSKEMPAKLDYFKKNADFFLKVTGMASIVENAQDLCQANLSDEFTNSVSYENVFVKVKVELTELIAKTPKPASNPLKNVGSQMYNWLLNPLFNA